MSEVRSTTERGQRRGKQFLVYAFVVPTAVQLLSKVIDNVQLSSILERVVSAWRAFTHLVWDDIIAALGSLVQISATANQKDALTFGVLLAGSGLSGPIQAMLFRRRPPSLPKTSQELAFIFVCFWTLFFVMGWSVWGWILDPSAYLQDREGLGHGVGAFLGITVFLLWITAFLVFAGPLFLRSERFRKMSFPVKALVALAWLFVGWPLAVAAGIMSAPYSSPPDLSSIYQGQPYVISWVLGAVLVFCGAVLLGWFNVWAAVRIVGFAIVVLVADRLAAAVTWLLHPLLDYILSRLAAAGG